METLEQVRLSEPVPPRQLQPGLPRDVETICLKCLAKEPARRYPTAGALADDLTRYLTNRPILARPTSAPERLGKWVRRRPATAASLAVAMVAALALLAGGVVYEGRLRTALRQSQISTQRAQEQKQNADARYRLAPDPQHHARSARRPQPLSDPPGQGTETPSAQGCPRLLSRGHQGSRRSRRHHATRRRYGVPRGRPQPD